MAYHFEVSRDGVVYTIIVALDDATIQQRERFVETFRSSLQEKYAIDHEHVDDVSADAVLHSEYQRDAVYRASDSIADLRAALVITPRKPPAQGTMPPVYEVVTRHLQTALAACR